jgi:hypothetical protein
MVQKVLSIVHEPAQIPRAKTRHYECWVAVRHDSRLRLGALVRCARVQSGPCNEC